MRFLADFHLHSKYSRAASKEMDLENMEKWARIKGVKLIGTGDFTHPLWFKELSSKLEEAEPGLFRLRNAQRELKKLENGFLFNNRAAGPLAGEEETRYLLTTEISCLYSKYNASRKARLLVFSPDFDTAEKINTHLGWFGNLQADGRPILNLDIKELAKIILKISKKCLLVPAHIWTPRFSIFGSQFGFDSLKECFNELTPEIYALETGLSSDPAMNWRWSALDRVTLLSNSDARRPEQIGREANVFEGSRLNYAAIIEAIKNGAREKKAALKLVETLELFPEQSKYYHDGHRKCGVAFSPRETAAHKRLCPKCGREVTIGVLSRSSRLADRPEGGRPERTIPFLRLIPLEEILAGVLGARLGSRKVRDEYKGLINRFGNEFKILTKISLPQLEAASFPGVAEGVGRMRAGQVKINPGYDGKYGKIRLFSQKERAAAVKQRSLF